MQSDIQLVFIFSASLSKKAMLFHQVISINMDPIFKSWGFGLKTTWDALEVCNNSQLVHVKESQIVRLTS